MPPASVRVRVRSGPRSDRFAVTEDDALGGALWTMLTDALNAHAATPAVFLIGAERVHVVDLRPLLAAKADVHRAVAGLAGMEEIEAVGMVGVLFRRKRGTPTWRYAVAFLEWPDGRWWLSHRRVEEDGT